jgi:ankyrin repeat protein
VGVALLSACSPSPHDLAGRGDVEKLQTALDADAEQLHALNGMNKTPLHYAVTYGREEAVAFLLGRGANPNAQDITGMTPLHCAVTLDRLDEAELLVAHGANLEVRDSFGDTPLHTAALHGRVKAIDWLTQNGADVTALNDDGKSALDLARREHKTGAANRLATLIER